MRGLIGLWGRGLIGHGQWERGRIGQCLVDFEVEVEVEVGVEGEVEVEVEVKIRWMFLLCAASISICEVGRIHSHTTVQLGPLGHSIKNKGCNSLQLLHVRLARMSNQWSNKCSIKEMYALLHNPESFVGEDPMKNLFQGLSGDYLATRHMHKSRHRQTKW